MVATRASPRPSSGWNRSRRPTPARPTRTSSRLAGVVAIKEANGPIIGWSSGRVDEPVSSVAPDGRLPNADMGSPAKTADHLRDGVFYRMGFDDREIVALSGAHALGRCHPDASGYDGPWTPTPTTLNNGYYSLLLNVEWTPRDWDGPFRYVSKKLMMPTPRICSSVAAWLDGVEAHEGARNVSRATSTSTGRISTTDPVTRTTSRRRRGAS